MTLSSGPIPVAPGDASSYHGPMRVHAVDPADVTHTHNLLQTPFWAAFKLGMGQRAFAFRYESPLGSGEVLALERARGGAAEHLYIPHGPEADLPEEAHGSFLAELSHEISRTVPTHPAFLRYDLRWRSPFTGPDYLDDRKRWLGRPQPRIQEMRMNYGIGERALCKAPTDVQPPDTVVIRVNHSDDALLSRMKPKTRYNVRLSLRNGLKIGREDSSSLGQWHTIYRDTCKRQGIICENVGYFEELFSVANSHPHPCCSDTPIIRLITARHRGRMVAGLIYAMFREQAYYLYGASSREDGSLMAPYGVQWFAMQAARADGCQTYDMFGVPPTDDPAHPMHGLYRFKTGFGGEIRHFRGCWDYPVDEEMYRTHAHLAADTGAYHLRR